MTDTKAPALPSLPRHIGALVYDALLLIAVLMVATLPWVLTRGNADPQALNFEPLGPVYQVYIALVIYAYFAIGWCRGGQTLGMKSWRLRLVKSAGGSVTPGQALVRLLVAPVAWLPLAAGIVWQHFDSDGLTWQDRASGTRVVVLRKGAASARD